MFFRGNFSRAKGEGCCVRRCVTTPFPSGFNLPSICLTGGKRLVFSAFSTCLLCDFTGPLCCKREIGANAIPTLVIASGADPNPVAGHSIGGSRERDCNESFTLLAEIWDLNEPLSNTRLFLISQKAGLWRTGYCDAMLSESLTSPLCCVRGSEGI
jgi:hypothetical protein